MTSTSYTNRVSRLQWLGVGGASILLAFPLFVMWTDPHVAHSQSLCPFKMLTGFPCPGCGLTKSIIFLYQGHILQSLGAHAFGWLAVVASVVYITAILFSTVVPVQLPSKFLYNRTLAYVLAILLGSYHFVRLIYFVAGHSLGEILRESIWA